MKNNRLGLLLIVSSLFVIGLVLGLLIKRQHDLYSRQIRIQGVGMTRSLSALPINLLVPKEPRDSVLHSLLGYHDNPEFGYAAVVAENGRVLVEAARPGVIMPAVALPVASPSLFGERALDAAGNQRPIREFYGPIMQDGKIAGFLRTGFFEPGLTLGGQDLSFFALIALPMFLLVPLIYFMMKREMAPLRQVSALLQRAVGERDQTARMALVDVATPVDVRAFSARIACFVQDAERRITALETEKCEEATGRRLLEYGASRLNAVLHGVPDGLFVLDQSGAIAFASAKIEPLLGVDAETARAQAVDVWCVDPELKGLLTRCRAGGMQAQAVLQPVRADTVEFHPQAAPGKRLRASMQALAGAQEGTTFGALVVVRDVTREYLSQQAGNEFVAHVSHELKSPLNAITMYSEMLQCSAANDEQLRIEATNVIHDEAERMSALINNLLNVSKMEMGSLKPVLTRVRIDELLDDIAANLRPQAVAAGLSLDLKMARELGTLYIDKDLLRIAINNLVTNAIKYTDAGGSVTLVAEEEEHDLVITVRDTGIGIALENQERVFDKFFRAAGGKRAGHGLGLYLASEIVGLHHGRIALQSTPGQGSAFTIRLKKPSTLVQEYSVL